MKFIFLALIILISSDVCAQSSRKVVTADKKVVTSNLEAFINSKGALEFRGNDINTGKPVMLNAENGLNKLKTLAKNACAVAPSSVTVSAGLISVTWDKSELCNN